MLIRKILVIFMCSSCISLFAATWSKTMMETAVPPIKSSIKSGMKAIENKIKTLKTKSDQVKVLHFKKENLANIQLHLETDITLEIKRLKDNGIKNVDVLSKTK